MEVFTLDIVLVKEVHCAPWENPDPFSLSNLSVIQELRPVPHLLAALKVTTLGRNGDPIAYHPAIPLEDFEWLLQYIHGGVPSCAGSSFCIIMIHIPGHQDVPAG